MKFIEIKLKFKLFIFFLFIANSSYSIVTAPFLIEEFNIENSAKADAVDFEFLKNESYIYASYINKWNIIFYNSILANYYFNRIGNIEIRLFMQSQEDFIAITKEGEVSDKFGIYDLGASLRWGRNIISKFNGGAGVKYIRVKVFSTVSDAIAFDFLGSYNLSSNIVINLSVENLGFGLKFEKSEDAGRNPLPYAFKSGINFLKIFKDLNLFFSFRYYIYETYQFGLGAELNLTDYFNLYCGYKYSPLSDFYGITTGLSFSYKKFKIDYAFLPGKILGDVHKAGLSFKF